MVGLSHLKLIRNPINTPLEVKVLLLLVFHHPEGEKALASTLSNTPPLCAKVQGKVTGQKIMGVGSTSKGINWECPNPR